jgi:hypothetical protein
MFVKGKSGNPTGRPKLPIELTRMKNRSLAQAIEILDKKIHDKAYIKELSPGDLVRFLELVYDRFGLPKVTTNQLTGADGESLIPPMIIFEAVAKKDTDVC